MNNNHMKLSRFSRTCASAALLFIAAVSLEAKKAPRLTGRVTIDGKPASGVCVSDGVMVVKTDSLGNYLIDSDKSEGFVFVITPSGAIAPIRDSLAPQFWAPLNPDSKSESHDFDLRSEDQSAYTILFVTDEHLTNDQGKHDLSYFHNVTMPLIKTLASEDAKLGAVYSFNLGDLSHDIFWYSNDFQLDDAKAQLVKEGFPVPLYSVSGNHDNDGATVGENVDRKAEWMYRKFFGPEYYSINIGSQHWIMMDDIEYVNTPVAGKPAKGIKGARDYDRSFTQKEFDWMQKDLANVSPETEVCLCMHVPLFFYREDGILLQPKSQMDTLDAIFSKFEHVNVYSGHTHKLYIKDHSKYPRFTQFSIPAVSGNMWTTGDAIISSGGSDAGIFTAHFVGKTRSDLYTPYDGDSYMRLYDANGLSEFYAGKPEMQDFFQAYPQRIDFSADSLVDCVMINCWNLYPGQTLEAWENGQKLPVERVYFEDPLYTVLYEYPVFARTKKAVATHRPDPHPHMFLTRAATPNLPVEVIIRDSDGNIVYTKSIFRPKPFDGSYSSLERR